MINYAALGSRGDGASPLCIEDFLVPHKAREAAEELDASDCWESSWYVIDSARDGIQKVDRSAFDRASISSSPEMPYKYSSVRTMEPSQLSGLPVCAILREELLGEKFSEALSRAIGKRVSPISDVNAASYSRGDFLRAHRDDLPGWVASLIIYLTPGDWREEMGGQLGFQGPSTKVMTAPRFNTAAVIPLSPSNSHWVSPVLDPGFHRRSLNLHFGNPDPHHIGRS